MPLIKDGNGPLSSQDTATNPDSVSLMSPKHISLLQIENKFNPRLLVTKTQAVYIILFIFFLSFFCDKLLSCYGLKCAVCVCIIAGQYGSLFLRSGVYLKYHVADAWIMRFGCFWSFFAAESYSWHSPTFIIKLAYQNCETFQLSNIYTWMIYLLVVQWTNGVIYGLLRSVKNCSYLKS